MEKRPKNEIIRRWFALIICQFLIGTGIAFARHPGLGVTPISSVPHVLAIWQPGISFGTWTFLWNLSLVFLQIILLRKDFKKIQLLQIPLSLIFGIFTDAGAVIANRFPVDKYPYMLMCLLIGIVILAAGISASVVCDVVLNPGEACVRVIAQRLHIKFGTVKIFFDSSCVLMGIILSLIFFDMHIVGIREGSLISAFAVGFFVKLIMPLINDDLTNWFKAAN